jgi:NADH-quinone oxidoreductase subunit J
MTREQLFLNMILLAAMTFAALWTVMTTSLLRAVIGLAITSGILTIVMFLLDAPMAGVFELSVCAGLIPAIFLSAISVAKRLSPEAVVVQSREQFRKFVFLPIIMALVGIMLTQLHLPAIAAHIAGLEQPDVRKVLWDLRHLDLLGQILILLAGAFGVVVLLKEAKNE